MPTRTITIPGVPLPASAICLGTALHGSSIPRDDAWALLDTFVERGGNFLDTAHVYAAWLPNGHGESERAIGAWMRSRGARSSIIVGTKGGHPSLTAAPLPRLRPEDIASDLADSCERLGTDVIDLYWLHRDDPAVPVDEVLDALQSLISAGRIRAIGASNWRPARLRAAAESARSRRVTAFCASQVAWSLRQSISRAWEPHETIALDDEALAYHRETGLRIIPYSPQAGGFFAKPLSADAPAIDAARWRRVAELARRRGRSPNSVALAYVLDHPCGGCAIIGSRTPAQVRDSMDAADVRLSRDEVAWLASG